MQQLQPSISNIRSNSSFSNSWVSQPPCRSSYLLNRKRSARRSSLWSRSARQRFAAANSSTSSTIVFNSKYADLTSRETRCHQSKRARSRKRYKRTRPLSTCFSASRRLLRPSTAKRNLLWLPQTLRHHRLENLNMPQMFLHNQVRSQYRWASKLVILPPNCKHRAPL